MSSIVKPATPQYQASDPLGSTASLFAFWPMTEGSGTVLHDVVNGHNLSFPSAPTWTANGSAYGATVAPGANNAAAATVTSGPTILPLTMAWIGSSDSTNGERAIDAVDAAGDLFTIVQFFSNGSAQPRVTGADGNSVNAEFATESPGSVNVYVAVFEVDGITFYANGTIANTKHAATLSQYTTALSSFALGTAYTTGTFAAAAVWKSALNQSQVTDFTNNPFRLITSQNQISLVSTDPLNIKLSATAWTGGTGAVTQQWHRSTTGGFAPSSSTAISGATSLNLTDTGLTANTIYFYRLLSTDSTGATFLSNQVSAVLADEAEIILVVSDSIAIQNASALQTVPNSSSDAGETYQIDGSGGAWPEDMIPFRQVGGKRRITHVANFGEYGRSSGDWLASSGHPFVAYSVTQVNALIASFPANVQPVVKVKIPIVLGANDARNANPPATFKSNIVSIANYFLGQNWPNTTIYPCYPTIQIPTAAQPQWTAATANYIAQYCAQIDQVPAACSAPSKVVVGTRTLPGWASDNPNELDDGVHPAPAGSRAMAQLVSCGMDEADGYLAGLAAGGSGTPTPTPTPTPTAPTIATLIADPGGYTGQGLTATVALDEPAPAGGVAFTGTIAGSNFAGTVLAGKTFVQVPYTVGPPGTTSSSLTLGAGGAGLSVSVLPATFIALSPTITGTTPPVQTIALPSGTVAAFPPPTPTVFALTGIAVPAGLLAGRKVLWQSSTTVSVVTGLPVNPANGQTQWTIAMDSSTVVDPSIPRVITLVGGSPSPLAPNVGDTCKIVG